MLPLFFAVALDASAVVTPAPGTYRYDAYVAGARAGRSTLVLSDTPAGLKIDERANGSTEAADVTIDGSTELDKTLSPLAYRASYTVRDKALDTNQKMRLNVSFAAREATVTAGNDVRTFPLGGSSKTFVLLDSSAVSGFFLLPAQMHARGSGDATALIPGLGAQRFLDFIPGDKPARPADVPAGDLSLSFAGESPLIEWYDPASLIPDQVSVPGDNLVIKRAK